ncbi:MAG: glutamate synthase-related protein [bacterium]
MPKKYNIHAKEAPPRFTPVGKYGIVDFNENCAGACHNCVKKKCVYRNYETESKFTSALDRPVEYMNECMNCLSCVQNCTRGVVNRTINPEFKWLGGGYWKPDLIISIWKQATTGKIPVSGAGYGGPFSGPGFDSMWTDMSEIVRPTRDGIHGREYISTSVDVGAKLPFLRFNKKGELTIEPPTLLDIPVPFFIDSPPFGDLSDNVFEALAISAREMNTFLILDVKNYSKKLAKYKDIICPLMNGGEVEANAARIKSAKIVALRYAKGVMKHAKKVKEINSGAVVMIRVAMTQDSDAITLELAKQGAEVIHLCAGLNGNVPAADGKTEFIKDAFRRIHKTLVKENIRDNVTLIAGGGIAMAEHMAKMIICGADCVSLGLPFLIAMECRMCRNCENGLDCPVEMSGIPPEHGAARIMNLAASWRNQLLEVLGAMGIREVRRLRAEFGRAMFREDLERDTFEKIFPRRT